MKFAELDQRVWRVGFLPQPWEWSDWRWAGPDGRFNGRWDPLDHGLYRTVYAADSLLACLVELLAPHRPDPYLVAEIDDIVEDDADAEQFPSARPGELDLDQWLVNRVAGTARLTGRYVDITAAETVAALHPLFKGKALAYNLKNFDAAALKNAENRLLTQEVSQFLWTRKNPDGTDFCDGIQFRSRHGDNLLLWAVYERDTDGQTSAHITGIELEDLNSNTPELRAALSLLGLSSR
ncbi:RES domain-containing protein [Arthrobacter sp. Z1-15]